MAQRAEQARNRLQILSDILAIANEGARKTHVMWRANLTHKQLNYYLDFLLGNGLIAKIEDTDPKGAFVFQTTDKGREFLDKYLQLREILLLR